MLDALVLRGKALRTQQAYIDAVARLARHGLLAPATKTRRLALARQLRAMPAPNPQAREDAQAFMRRVAAIEIGWCPHCKAGRWLVIEQLPGQPAGVAAATRTACRGPP